GIGTPVVVFEAGLDINGSLSWSAVHDAVARVTRACAYSRAGIMWSDPRNGATGIAAIAQDLHAALAKGGEKPPFVLVGHSLGGLYIVGFTTRFPSEVAGLVFVEAAHPEQRRRFRTLLPAVGESTPRSYRLKVALRWTGIMRFDRESFTGVLNQPAIDVQAAAAYAPSSLAAMLREEDAINETLSDAGASHDLGDRPTVVLTGTGPIPSEALNALELDRARGQQAQGIWKQMQDDEASWSSRSKHELVPDASHYMQFDRPDAVIAGVRSVVESVRGSRRDK